MKLISHRGNISGKIIERENSLNYIMEAIDYGFDVEIDLWVKKNVLFLGHDSPQYQIEKDFLYQNINKLWIHSKNLESSEWLIFTDFNWFWHENDKMVLTSKGIVWSNTGVFVKNGITVEFGFKELPDYILGVCSDNILKYGTRSS